VFCKSRIARQTSIPGFSALPFIDGKLAVRLRFVGGSSTPEGRFANGGGFIRMSCMDDHTTDV
jgi:hypothetical protein